MTEEAGQGYPARFRVGGADEDHGSRGRDLAARGFDRATADAVEHEVEQPFRVVGIVHDRRIDRQIRQAQEDREPREARDAQKSSSRSTVPSTATWYADGRRSKKLVSS